MLGIHNLKTLVYKSLEEQVNELPRLTPNVHTLRTTGYDAKAVVLDAILVFLFALKVYPLVLKKLKRMILTMAILVLAFAGFAYFTRQPFAVANTSTVAQPNHLPAIQEQIKINEAPIFNWPVGGYISQHYWWGHRGVDLPNAIGTPVHPVAEGEVVLAGWDGGYGLSIVIKHSDGFTSRYAHLARVLVKTGAKVSKNDIIGNTGATGVVTGPHLHFELLWYGEQVDPEHFLPAFKADSRTP